MNPFIKENEFDVVDIKDGKEITMVRLETARYEELVRNEAMYFDLRAMIAAGVSKSQICEVYNIKYKPSLGDRLEKHFAKFLDRDLVKAGETEEAEAVEEKAPVKGKEDIDLSCLTDEEAEAEGWTRADPDEVEAALPEEFAELLKTLRKKNPGATMKIWKKAIGDSDPAAGEDAPAETGADDAQENEETEEHHFLEIVQEEAGESTGGEQ